ncbi:MAG TPA: methyltransferase domain-containing protein [Spirochaetota bacterium]|nr:methyltransferase domain-containing protein [Spirochaetota bacterium]HPG49077.1 methyltransferase domain-containing protein [Spirochaetota bacterium]HPN11487.1 methyltransferase domain-containing protein [Spirochaetota bacterium]HQL83054.1 methyltransferase domain-containing protein [Spirochaetota bacterium]
MLTVDFDRLGVREGDIALDAGCGFGRHSLEFISRGAQVYSMDMDMDSLRKTRFSLTEMKKQIRNHEIRYFVHSGDALNLPFKDGSFDRIICSEVMEHVRDDDLACRELTRVLKKNGRIAITVPTIFSEHVYDLLTYEYYTSPGGHIRKYRPKELAAIMRRNGLEIYGVGFKHAYHTVWWMIRSVVGLHLSDHPVTKAYHRFLHLGLYSNLMRKIESFLDYFFPKSVVIYAWKK